MVVREVCFEVIKKLLKLIFSFFLLFTLVSYENANSTTFNSTIINCSMQFCSNSANSSGYKSDLKETKKSTESCLKESMQYEIIIDDNDTFFNHIDTKNYTQQNIMENTETKNVSSEGYKSDLKETKKSTESCLKESMQYESIQYEIIDIIDDNDTFFNQIDTKNYTQQNIMENTETKNVPSENCFKNTAISTGLQGQHTDDEEEYIKPLCVINNIDPMNRKRTNLRTRPITWPTEKVPDDIEPQIEVVKYEIPDNLNLLEVSYCLKYVNEDPIEFDGMLFNNKTEVYDFLETTKIVKERQLLLAKFYAQQKECKLKNADKRSNKKKLKDLKKLYDKIQKEFLNQIDVSVPQKKTIFTHNFI